MDNRTKRVVPFHEYGNKYYWHITSGEVQNKDGVIVAVNCVNLKEARKAVRGNFL